MMHKRNYIALLSALIVCTETSFGAAALKKAKAAKEAGLAKTVETAKSPLVTPAPIDLSKATPTAAELANLTAQADNLQKRLDAIKAQLGQAHQALGKQGRKSKRNARH